MILPGESFQTTYRIYCLGHSVRRFLFLEGLMATTAKKDGTEPLATMTTCEFSRPSPSSCDVLAHLFLNNPIPRAEVEQLLESGCCDVNAANGFGTAPIRAAIMFGDRKVIELLLAHGATVDAGTVQFAEVCSPKSEDIVGLLRSVYEDATLNKEISPVVIERKDCVRRL